MKLGYTHVERFAGGAKEWTATGRFHDISERSWVETLVASGATIVDTSGQFPGAVHKTAAEIIADPAGAIGNPPVDTRIVLMGAAAPDGPLYRAAQALEEARYSQTTVYTEGYAGWSSGG